MDDVDRANAQAEQWLELAIHAARGELPPGTAGECDLCGEWSGRLINGACAPCRDRIALKQRLWGST
jgi:hypothetical protein